ncbi:MAG: hypothetical protein GY803_21480 [Chloroflexi bacterium]|nr:hypothetical protein [Chloroflexota bacterium]
MFSQISRNWAGKPLHSWDIMLNFIRGTTTKTGLLVKAFLVDRDFEKKKTVSDEERASDLSDLELCYQAPCLFWMIFNCKSANLFLIGY